MMRAFVVLPIFFIFLAVVLAIPILIGVYVYRDANRRQMNPVLWTLIAVFAPSLIGFIIYLLVRSGHPELQCPRCGSAVAEDFVVCPKCGVRLRAACPVCGQPVSPDWVVCPRCAAPLPTDSADFAMPVRAGDNTLWKILIAVIVVPILLIVFLVIGVNVYTGSEAMAGMEAVSIDDLYSSLESPETQAEVRAWLESRGREPGHAYILSYTRSWPDAPDEYFYLLYVPGAGDSPEVGFSNSAGPLQPGLTVELEYTGKSTSVYCLTTADEKPPRLNIVVDGKRMDCEVTEVTYNPTVYYIESSLP